MLSTQIKRALDCGSEVILVKDAANGFRKSYSLVKRYEGNKVRRTPFEALSAEDVYEFSTGKFTMEHLDNNPRIHFYKSVEVEDIDDEYDDEDYDDDCHEERVNRNADSGHLVELIRIQNERIAHLESLILAQQTPTPPTPKLSRAIRATNKPRRVSVGL